LGASGVLIAAGVAGFMFLMPQDIAAPDVAVPSAAPNQTTEPETPETEAPEPVVSEAEPTPVAQLPEGPQEAAEITQLRALIASGDAQNLNDALGQLITLSRSSELDAKAKQTLNIMLAHMYDPKFHSSATSPFPEPNISAAIRAYEAAQQQGADVASDLARLKEAE
jgi:hypothetical protein